MFLRSGVSVKSRIRLKGGFAFDGQDGSRDFPSSLSPPHFCSSFDTQAKQAQQRGETHTRHGLRRAEDQRSTKHHTHALSSIRPSAPASSRTEIAFHLRQSQRSSSPSSRSCLARPYDTYHGLRLSYTIAVFRLGRTRHPLRSSPHRFFHPQQCYQAIDPEARRKALLARPTRR